MKIQKGIYRHYKGNFYEVLGTVHHSETLEVLALYRALYKARYGRNSLWIRPLKMFLEKVVVDGKRIPRFEKVSGKVRRKTGLSKKRRGYV